MELAWAAGFFDGEGTVSLIRWKKSPRGKEYLTVSIGQSYVTEELERFGRAVGFPQTKVSGPFRGTSGNRGPVYKWQASGKRAHCVMQRLLPYLCSRKREKYLYLVASRGV